MPVDIYISTIINNDGEGSYGVVLLYDNLLAELSHSYSNITTHDRLYTAALYEIAEHLEKYGKFNPADYELIVHTNMWKAAPYTRLLSNWPYDINIVQFQVADSKTGYELRSLELAKSVLEFA